MCKIIFHILLLPTINQYPRRGRSQILKSRIQILDITMNCRVMSTQWKSAWLHRKATILLSLLCLNVCRKGQVNCPRVPFCYAHLRSCPYIPQYPEAKSLQRGEARESNPVSPDPTGMTLFSSVTQSCPTLCYLMDAASKASLSITNSWSLLVMPSNHLILCRPLLLLPSIFPSISAFPVSQFFTSGGQNIGVSASASVLPMNIQDWFPLGWIG